MSTKLTNKHKQTLSSVRFWGASTSAHQVEGNTTNQWTVWEEQNAQRLAAHSEDEFGSWLPAWSSVMHEAQNASNYISGSAAEHYSRYEQDFDHMKSLNFNAYRFSIEWSRIEPQEGEWDQKEIEHYRQYLRALKKRGIEPVVTLWHWTMPVWFCEKKDFRVRSNITYFEHFVGKVMDELGDEFTYVCILNEPNVYTIMGTLEDRWPPQDKSIVSFVKTYLNLVTTHKRVYKQIHGAKHKIGIAYAVSHVERVGNSPLAFLFAWVSDYIWNVWFLARVRRQLDFIGINHYFTNYFGWKGEIKKHERRSDYGWHMNPYNLRFVVTKLWNKFGIPLMITENGVADAQDQYRQWWIEQSLSGLTDSVSDGAEVIGYLHWSLLDNFEWAEGYWPRFGLIEVDYKSQKRHVRKSAQYYGDLIADIRILQKDK